MSEKFDNSQFNNETMSVKQALKNNNVIADSKRIEQDNAINMSYTSEQLNMTSNDIINNSKFNNMNQNNNENDTNENDTNEIKKNNQEIKNENKKTKKGSFADSINFMIVLSFGIAFLVIYISSVVVLLMSGEPDHSFYIKTIFMFIFCLLIYVISALLTTLRIKKLFYPLDKLAHGLLNDEIRMYGDNDDIKSFADTLRNDMRRLEAISRELDDTKMNLDAVSSKVIKEQTNMENSLDKSEKYLNGIERAKEHLKSDFRKERVVYKELPIVVANINYSNSNIKNISNEFKGSIKDCIREIKDTNDELTEVKEAYELLYNMLTQNSDLIEGVFSELAHLQAIASQMKLYSSNLSLEIARSGVFSPSINAGMDDLKELADKVSEKTDAISMLVIRTKNSNKLAQDQSNFCTERMDECKNYFYNAEREITDVSKTSDGIISSLDQIANSLDKLMMNINDLQAIMNSKVKELDNIEDNESKLRNWRKGLQENIKK